MKPIKVLHMYADILDLYGDSGNMEILSYRCQMRQIPFVCDHYRLNDPVPNFSDYDLIYLGGGADMEQRMLSSDLLRCKDGLKKAHADGVFFLMICGGYQLMGKFYRDADGNELPGLLIQLLHHRPPQSPKALHWKYHHPHTAYWRTTGSCGI